MASRLRFGHFEVWSDPRVLLVDGRPSVIAAPAVDLLLALIEHRDRPVNNEELSRLLALNPHTLQARLATLKALLGEPAIASVPGRGHRFSLTLEDDTARPEGPPPAVAVYRFGPCDLRPAERLLLIDGASPKLGARAFDVLVALVELRFRLVTKNELLDLIWPGLVVEENNLPTHVSSLRKLLGQGVIDTVPGRGYRFVAELSDEDSGPLMVAQPTSTAASTPSLRRTNLPPAAEALFGRVDDLVALVDIMAAHKLVTILGTGGIGKTRLAQALGLRLADRWPDGIWWVDLAATDSPDGIVTAIANATGLHLGGGDSTALCNALAPREMGLILDNCEAIAGHVARTVEQLLAFAPGVCFIATSREPLKVPGEQVYRLDGLVVPAASASAAEARACSAIQLFERRAAAADRHFAINEANVAAAISVCRRLEGIPLALELAAARLPLLGLGMLDQRLDERLRLLKGQNRMAPARHQTLQATLDWSHGLLTSDEQKVLRRLAVFAGPFRLEPAQRVASGNDLDPWDMVDALSGLVDKSMVEAQTSTERHGFVRYRLLETTRLYAVERLAEQGEAAPAEGRHAVAMASLAQDLVGDYWRMPDVPFLQRYAPDYDDLQAAYAHACREKDPEIGAPILQALFKLDHLRSNSLAMRPWLEAAVAALLPSAAAQARARIQLQFGVLGLGRVGQVSTENALREAVQALRGLEDRQALFEASLAWAASLATSGRCDEADRALEEARMLRDPAWPPRFKWWEAEHHKHVAIHRGDSQAYRQALHEELHWAKLAGSPCQMVSARVNLADAALMDGDIEQSILLGRDAVAQLQPLGLPELQAVAMLNLCAALIRHGDHDEARHAAAQTLPIVWRHKLSGWFLCHLALLAAGLSQPDVAARLLGYVDAWMTATELALQPNERLAATAAQDAAEASLGASVYASLRKAGMALTDAQAFSLAESLVEDRPAARAVGER